MKSVRMKMVGFVVASLVVALGFYSTLLYINLKRIIVANQEKHLSSLATAICSDIALWLDGKKREMSAVADSVSLAGNNKLSISTRLKIHAKGNPTYEMVFYADKGGDAITSSNFEVNISDRTYFQQVLDTGREVVSDPVISRESEHPVVIIAAPVKNESLITGILGCTISLNYLSQLISNLTSRGTGYGFVVQGDGTTIIHPDNNLVLTHNILKDPQMDPSLQAAVSQMIRRQTGLQTYVYKDVLKYLAFAPVPGSNWSLGLNAPVAEVLGQLTPINKLIIITPVFVVILASALTSFLMIILIGRPITRLRDMMSRVEDGDLDVRADYGLRDEIGQLMDSFDRMVETIKNGREKIKQSEEKYRSLFENAMEGFFQTTQDGRFLSANPSLASILGFDSPQEFIKTINNIGEQLYVNQDERKTLEKVLEAEGGVEGYETQFLRKGGDIIWVSLNIRAARNDKGSVLYYEGTVVDITRRKQAEEALTQSERRLSNIIEFLPDATFAIDRDGCIIAWNRAIEEMTGYTSEMMLGKGNYEYAIPFYNNRRPILVDFLSSWDDDIAETYPFIKRDGDTLFTEMDVPHVRGEKRNLWGKASPLRDEQGNLTGAIESIRDITDHKQMEKDLRESEERYRLLFESAAEGILIAQGNMLKFVNPAIEDITGYSRDILLSQPFTAFIHPDDRDLVFERHMQRMAGDDVLTGYSFRTTTARGDERWIEIKSTVITWDGKLSNLSFLVDITERKHSEEERNKLNEQLNRAQKLESIGTLAGGIAHDFNNLLMGIQGNASLMMLDLDPSHPHHARLKQIEEQVRSAADLTGQLLGFARGGLYELKATDMKDIIETTATMFGRTKKEITIHKKYGNELWIAEVDRTQMVQVFMNLFVNAWQAMPGGGEIFIEANNFYVIDEDAHPLASGRHVKITVGDTGTGMDAKTRERIFDPFFTTKEMGRGTGLGLAMVYGIVKGHGGMIDVTSEPGEGTTFAIYLPVTKKAIVKECAVVENELPRGTETILLVDDETMVLDVATELLESLGYRVYGASSGQEAVTVYHEKKDEIDLVILDMIMPGISGGKTFDRLREISPTQKVLLSSGYSISGEVQEILKRGCNGFLQKPFQLKELAREVRVILDINDVGS